jgi:hypothetical protein
MKIKRRKIMLRYSSLAWSSVFYVNVDSTFEEAKRTNLLFFKNAHGAREVITMYRGFLLVSHTEKHGCSKGLRFHVMYAYGSYNRQKSITTNCMGHYPGRKAMERAADEILEKGEYVK